ncbi:hypothetical protein D3C72_1453510 [compost metagenome]
MRSGSARTWARKPSSSRPMLGFSSPTASKMSTTLSDTTAWLMIWRTASSRCSSVRCFAVMSRLVRITLTPCMKATSSRTALASSSVQLSVKAWLIARAVSAKRFLPSCPAWRGKPSTWLAAPASTRWPPVRKPL